MYAFNYFVSLAGNKILYTQLFKSHLIFKNDMKNRNLPQDPVFQEFCTKDLDEITEVFDLETNVSDCFILSAAAICDNGIDHLLDGYSWAIFARIENDILTVKTVRVAADENVRLREKHGTARQFGLFTGHLPAWRKLFLGRIPQLLATGRAIERQTAHQPIYYPRLNQVSFCSTYTYPSYEVNWGGALEIYPVASHIRNAIPPSHYTCMHPHYDPKNKQVLTYSFLHSKFLIAILVCF